MWRAGPVVAGQERRWRLDQSDVRARSRGGQGAVLHAWQPDACLQGADVRSESAAGVPPDERLITSDDEAGGDRWTLFRWIRNRLSTHIRGEEAVGPTSTSRKFPRPCGGRAGRGRSRGGGVRQVRVMSSDKRCAEVEDSTRPGQASPYRRTAGAMSTSTTSRRAALIETGIDTDVDTPYAGRYVL
jgi:hypothetical protein